MNTDRKTTAPQPDKPAGSNQGVSAPKPAEGANDAPAPTEGSPRG